MNTKYLQKRWQHRWVRIMSGGIRVVCVNCRASRNSVNRENPCRYVPMTVRQYQ